MCAMVLAALSAVRLVMLCCQRCQLFCPNTALSLVHKAVNACLRELKGKKNTHTQKGWGDREKGGRTMTISISSARKHFHVSDAKIVRDFFFFSNVDKKGRLAKPSQLATVCRAHLEPI